MRARPSTRASAGIRAATSVVLGLGLLLTPSARGQTGRVRAEEALARTLTVELPSQPIQNAIRALSERTGVAFTLDASVAELMPYGARTRIAITIKGLTLRDGFSQICDGLGLRMEPGAERVAIVPGPVLERLKRRITADEVQSLTRLAKARTFSLSASPVTMAFRVEGDPQPQDSLATALKQATGENALRLLEAATASLKWTWRPDGSQIIVERRRDAYSELLRSSFDWRFNSVTTEVVLRDICARAGVPLVVDPSVLTAVNAAQRRVDLITRRSAWEVLDVVCKGAGLEFTVTDDGVSLVLGSAQLTTAFLANTLKAADGADSAAPALPSPASTRAGAENYVDLLVELKTGVWVRVSVRRDELPADLRADLERRMREVFGDVTPILGRARP